MFRKTLLLLLIASQFSCKARLRKNAEVSDPQAAALTEGETLDFKLLDHDYETKINNYSLQAKTTQDVLMGVYRYLSGMSCTSKLTMKYSELTKNSKGEDENFTQAQDYTYNLFAMGNLDQMSYIKQNTANHKPQVNLNFNITCWEQRGTKASVSDLIPTLNVDFSCKYSTDKFPKKVNQISSFECPTERSYGVMIPSLTSLLTSWFDKFSFAVNMVQLNTDSLYDYTNCPEDVASDKPFYLRITQGLYKPGNDRFTLSTRIDGQRVGALANVASSTGVYSLSVAYCPIHTNDSIALSFVGSEKDTLSDSHYLPDLKNINLKRGQRATYYLSEQDQHWYSSDTIRTNESQIIVEVFDQTKKAQADTVETQEQKLKTLSQKEVLAQTKEKLQGDVYVQVQLFLNEMKSCFTYDAPSLKAFVTDSLKNASPPYDEQMIDTIVATEGQSAEALAAKQGDATGMNLSGREALKWLGELSTGKKIFLGVVAAGVVATVIAVPLSIKNKHEREKFEGEQVYERCKDVEASKNNFVWTLGELKDTKAALGV